MKESEIKHIENLIERFFEGTTTNKEEKELYAFFNHQDIPPHLEPYLSVFNYFDKELEQELLQEKSIQMPANPKEKPDKPFIFLMSIAAVIFAFLIFKSFSPPEENTEIAQGSYIKENGNKITDLSIIRKDLQLTIHYTEEIAHAYEETIRTTLEKEEKYNTDEAVKGE